ncbi:MAG TPA: hypothetical protein VME92_19380 [Acetobacteraceae bacterium]|nr:hypothetical protein [Acetobacteraceae bacterium]
MRGLLAAVIIMGVLIVGGTTALGVLIARRVVQGGMGTAPAVTSRVLQEPAGTRIAGLATVSDRLALLLQGGGPDRVVVLDPGTGRMVATIGLAH